MPSPTDHRSLVHLAQNGASARVLNLAAVHERHGESEALSAAPFFINRTLNRALFVKHRLRGSDLDKYERRRGSATKVILLYDSEDLRIGGASFLLGETSTEATLAHIFGRAQQSEAAMRDRQVLAILDRLPSLDAFVLRETLGREGVHPASHYFAISEGDLERMRDYIRSEVAHLARMATQRDDPSGADAATFADHIMEDDNPALSEILRQSLRLNREDYQNGMFAWRGFLYYKWQLAACTADLGAVVNDIRNVRFLSANPEPIAAANASRHDLLQAVRRAAGEAHGLIGRYVEAFEALTARGDAAAFRRFLLTAPRLFQDVGERVGVLTDLVTYWRRRFMGEGVRSCDAIEAATLFDDVLANLGGVAGLPLAR